MSVGDEVVGAFEGEGLVVLLGVSVEDTEAEAVQTARKVAGLRMLDGERSVADADAPVLAVSQFTLYGDVRKGRRPSWTRAAKGEAAEPLYERFMAELEAAGATAAGSVAELAGGVDVLCVMVRDDDQVRDVLGEVLDLDLGLVVLVGDLPDDLLQ